ncbi:MAG: protein translocase subunit SecD [Sedimentisphaerales bacterium]|nr:protein translocase subunit SecD [Sedimentisphaerales bacterium]
MSKNLTPKIISIIVLVIVAALTLYPPSKTLKPGIDLAGGTRLIYQIDTHGLEETEKKDLSQKLITVLRRRIDPANIQNLIWLPQGSTRFEIRMPLASAEAHQKRQNYEQAETELLDRNVSAAKIMRSLKEPAEKRAELFKQFAQEDPNGLAILDTLAAAHDERELLKNKRDALFNECEAAETKMSSAGLDLDKINENISNWAGLDDKALSESINTFTDVNDNRDMLIGYVKTYVEWSKVSDQFLEKNADYIKARNAIDKLNLSKDKIDYCLELPEKSSKRKDQIEQLKTEFPDRAVEIDRIVKAFDEYRQFRGRLDDPKDLQRMLKGAGILEFRILPTEGHPEVDMDQIAGYVEKLKNMGPKAASDNQYVWCEIENAEEWRAADREQRPSITETFGDKYYVLASNKTDESMLHSSGKKEWKLERSYPTTDEMGRRAIGFLLDDRGGNIFFKVTGKNIDRPLCILLDGIAISAPTIESRIRRQGSITGSFSQTEVEDMVNKLNAGSLPARLIEQPISVNTIGPSIGADNRDQGIRAGLIGLAAVIACMAIYYCLAGSIADVALLLNMLFVLAIMAGVRATFTLPGIAGIILTIGMSVDANVLVFERICEEQLRGASLRIAIQNGYQRAFRTIFDANLTTFITAAILYWRASEEVKGFAIVLMLGIASSMFTALFVTRVVFDLLLSKRIIKEHLLMLRLIHNPNVNWMRSRPIFLGISSVLILGGLFVFFTRNDLKNNKYDIEFTGGTNIQVNLKDALERQQVEERIQKIGINLNNPGLQTASVYSIGDSGKQYEISTIETNKIAVTVTFPQAQQQSADNIISAIETAQRESAGRLGNLIVTQDTNNAGTFNISTSQMNQSLVKEVLEKAFPAADISEPQVDEVVNNAILTAFTDQLEIQQNLQPEIVSEENISEELIDSYPELIDYLGGVKIECQIQRSATAGEIAQRFRDLLFKPDMQNVERYPYEILDSNLNALTDPNQPVKSFIYVSADPEASYRELSEEERTRFVENERAKVLGAAHLETSLPRVRQFDPSVGSEQKQQALIAIVLSLFAIITYIWIRFGDVRYGIAAIIALVHDVCITLGAVTVCAYIAGTSIGDFLLIDDFKINLAMIAAFLTLIGYSLNDTIVVFDRIRENRGKARQLNPKIITDSINQTISRTIMTSFTTFIVVLIMYIFGGTGLRGFTFAIGIGIVTGTYSSIAIAAPMLIFHPIQYVLGLFGNEKQTGKRK